MNGHYIIFNGKLLLTICDLRSWLDRVQDLTVNSKMLLYVDKKLMFMVSGKGVHILGEVMWGPWNFEAKDVSHMISMFSCRSHQRKRQREEDMSNYFPWRINWVPII